MPPDMEVSMRHTKLKPEEAALLAGELTKPTWESRNEGIHERVSFEDSIWGFDLAGGAYYKTPLRVTSVKPDSRAEKAGIRPGDRLKRINGIDTITLTIQEAHELIIQSGIHLKLSVTAPEDEEDAYYCYEDPIVDGYDSEEERRLEEERARKRRVHAKVSSYWSLQWPWVNRKRFIYRESNCYMVNSKYEEARRDKYPVQPTLRYTDDILGYKKDGDTEVEDETKRKIPTLGELHDKTKKSNQEKLTNGNTKSDVTHKNVKPRHASEDKQPVDRDSSISPIIEEDDNVEQHLDEPSEEFKETDDEDLTANTVDSVDVNDHLEDAVDNETNEILNETSDTEVTEEDKENEESVHENDDDVINEVLAKNNDNSRSDDDNILDSILSDDGQNLENSESNNER